MTRASFCVCGYVVLAEGRHGPPMTRDHSPIPMVRSLWCRVCGIEVRRRQELRRDAHLGRLFERVGEADDRRLRPASADERHADRQWPDEPVRDGDAGITADGRGAGTSTGPVSSERPSALRTPCGSVTALLP